MVIQGILWITEDKALSDQITMHMETMCSTHETDFAPQSALKLQNWIDMLYAHIQISMPDTTV